MKKLAKNKGKKKKEKPQWGDQETWAREQANKFYNDFETLDIKESIIAVTSLIRTKVLNINQVNIMLDNMIKVFTLDEEYEKCHIVNEIKKGLSNDRI